MTQMPEKNKAYGHGRPSPYGTGLSTEATAAAAKPDRRASFSLVWIAAMALAAGPLSCAAATAGAQPSASSSARPWLAYMQKLEAQAQQTPAVQSALAGVKAEHGAVSARTGDRDLSLDANYTDYPNGAGTGTNGSFTNLQQRGEIRASWGMLDFFGRRPGRIASAKAQVQAAQANVAYTRQDRQGSLVNISVAQWSAHHQREALRHALSDLHNANQALDKLQNHSLSTSLAETVNAASDRALKLQAQIEQRLASLPAPDHTLPLPPASYWTLPEQPPSESDLTRVAKHTPLAAKLQAQSQSFDAQTRAHWAQNFKFKIYGGYVHEKVRNESGYQNGPEVGASLSIPIGGGGGGSRANAHWQAQQKALAAKAAIQQQQQQLRQLRQQWTQAISNLKSQTDLLRHQAKRVNILHQRYVTGAGAKTPEPWQLQIQKAEFWSSVAATWRVRGQWIQAVLDWSVYDPGYLRQHASAHVPPASKGLCSPLPQCPQA